jgi:hypothetical protein
MMHAGLAYDTQRHFETGTVDYVDQARLCTALAVGAPAAPLHIVPTDQDGTRTMKPQLSAIAPYVTS